MVLTAFITTVNLRGVRESGMANAIPAYLFLGAISLMIVTGLVRALICIPSLVDQATSQPNRFYASHEPDFSAWYRHYRSAVSSRVTAY